MNIDQTYYGQTSSCASPYCSCRQSTGTLGYTVPSILEQMGQDGPSKLAAAINRLCDILERS